MNPYFTKIDLDLSDLDIDGFNATFIGHFSDNFDVYRYDAEIQQMLINRLPEKARPHVIEVGYVELTSPGIKLHTDTRDALLLYYVRSCGGTTRFHTYKNTDTVVNHLADQIFRAGYTMWNPEDVVEVDSFTANDGDCYIMNTKTVHSVDTTDTTVKRKLLQYWFKPRTSYEEVLAFFELT